MSARRYWFPKRYTDVVARLRVPFGFVLVAAFLYFSAPDRLSLEVGLPIAVAGLVLRGWAAGHLEKNRQLAVSGPYGHMRNPLYVGTLIVAAGLVVAARRWQLGLLFAIVFAFIYLPVIEAEEQHLRNLFPSYADYAKRVPMLMPRLRGGGGARRFRYELYRTNREYEALLGFLAGAAVLIAKVIR